MSISLEHRSITGCFFDVMGHDRASVQALGPKPDEGYALAAPAPDGQRHELLVQGVDARVNRPSRKSQILPALQMDLLQVLAYRHRHQRTSQIVSFAYRVARESGGGARRSVHIALVAQIRNHLRGIKGQHGPGVMESYIVLHIVQMVADTPGSKPGRGAPVTDRVRAETEIAAVTGEVLRPAQINEFFGTPEVSRQLLHVRSRRVTECRQPPSSFDRVEPNRGRTNSSRNN